MEQNRQKLSAERRRDQILAAATELLAVRPSSEVSLTEVAQAAGVTRAILYRHFSGRDELCRDAVRRARICIELAVGEPPYDAGILRALLGVAAAEPAAFRLLFDRAPREPALADLVADQRQAARASAARELGVDTDDPWSRWTARLAPDLTTAAILAWLDVGAPDLDDVALRIERALRALG